MAPFSPTHNRYQQIPWYPVSSSVMGELGCPQPLKWGVLTGKVKWGLSKIVWHSGLHSGSSLGDVLAARERSPH